MTNPTASPVNTDPRPGLTAALDLARGVFEQIQAGDLERPTPCDDFDVDQLAGHMIGAVRRIAAVGRGEHFSSVDPSVSGIPLDDLVPELDRAAAAYADAWSDPDVLTKELELPFGVLPGQAALGVYISEITVHTWDLATAIGAAVEWIEPIVAGSLEGMRRALPAEPRGESVGIPFGSPVAVSKTAPLIEQLVAYTGRNPEFASGR